MNWPSDEMRACGGRSSWQDWTPKVGMIGYVVHYWQPNHPDVFFRSNVNRTLLLLQIGNHFVPVGENGVKVYHTPGAAETREQTVSADNLNGLTRRGRGSNRSRKFSDSIRKLKSEEDPVMPVVVLPEEERGESGKDEEMECADSESRKFSPARKLSEELVAKEVPQIEIKLEEKEKGEEVVADSIERGDDDQVESSSTAVAANIDEELSRVRE